MYLLLLTLALTLFFLLALTRPNYALTLLAGLLPTYLLRFSIIGIPTNFFEVSVWLAFLTYLISLKHPHPNHHPIQGEGKNTFLSLITHYPLLITLVILFITAAIFSTLLTPTPHSLGILKSWILTPIVFGFLVAQVKWKTPLILSGSIISLLGLFQLGSLERITSIYDVPNSLALFIAPLIILAFFRGGYLNYLAGLVMFIALLGTQSIAGLGAVLLILAVGFFLKQSYSKTHLYIIIILFLVATTALTFTGRLTYFLQPLYNSTTHTSLTVRQQLRSISWELIKEHPIRGIGLGQFEPAYQQKLHERFARGLPAIPEFVFRDPHNWLLSFWLNTGLLGLLSFAALNLLALKPLFKKPYSLQPTHYALLTLLIFGLFDTIYWKNDLAALHWLLLGLLLRFV